MSKRREARECTVQALYAWTLAGGDPQHHIETVIVPPFKDDASTTKFATDLFLKTLRHGETADELIEQHTKNWEFNRIALLDRLILRLAIVELLHLEDVPPKVSINEAIELAKAFSTNKSGQFVNGILDAVLEQLVREKRIHKTGRGLVDFTPPKKKSP